MDRIARELGLDPLELRRRNLYEEGDLTATGQRLFQPGAKTVLEAALQAASDLDEARRPEHPGSGGLSARRSRGRGVSLVFHGCGFTGNGEARLKGKLAMAVESGRVRIYTGSTELGQGTDTIFPQIAAEELGIDLSLVEIAPHDTQQVPDSGPTVASRTAMVVGGVCQKAAKALREAVQERLGANESFERLLSNPAVEGLRVESQYVDDGSLQWNEETYEGDAYPTYGWSCSVVDLTVDLDTGEVLYERFISATDVGKALNPVLASGQIEGDRSRPWGGRPRKRWSSMSRVGCATIESPTTSSPPLSMLRRCTRYWLKSRTRAVLLGPKGSVRFPWMDPLQRWPRPSRVPRGRCSTHCR